MNSRVAHSKHDHVYADNYDYNFVIPKNLVLKLNAVVKAERKKRSKSKYFNQSADDNHPEGTTEEIIAYFPDGTPQFTRFVVIKLLFCSLCCMMRCTQCCLLCFVLYCCLVLLSTAVYGMNEFYNVVRKLDAWKEDVDWLLSTK
ncbi:unnamed protein product [Phytophthora fragariaefolia]|uniref:Unnamed protein product n=1 Tax=Phytophthora fragariaefolia TaxID=1490495 RepID=A0A9W6TWN3_9STRA|nr:unnamed protein product [Phytophthora fragariaefolia]